jgi:hypothetical protein
LSLGVRIFRGISVSCANFCSLFVFAEVFAKMFVIFVKTFRKLFSRKAKTKFCENTKTKIFVSTLDWSGWIGSKGEISAELVVSVCT